MLLLLLLALSARAEDCADCRRGSPYAGRDNGIALILNDMYGKENRLKTVENVEKYHRCLLSSKSERDYQQKYAESYRYQIAVASESFGVPIALLTCLCGRESRFNSQEKSTTSSATGICQAMTDSLADVERWRTTIPKLRQSWEMFVNRLGNRLEDPSCASSKLMHDVLLRCPSLGVGVAALYLNFTYSRLDPKANMADPGWEKLGINTLTAVAGTYFLGVGLGEKAARKSPGRDQWPAALSRQVCEYAAAKNLPEAWQKQRLNELSNHMTSIRNCVQEGHWLDHQGKPMSGECAMAPAEREKQSQEVREFRGQLLSECPK